MKLVKKILSVNKKYLLPIIVIINFAVILSFTRIISSRREFNSDFRVSEGTNLVTNSGFEAFGGSTFTDWKIIEGSWAPNTTIFKGGTQSCRVDLTEDVPASGIYRGIISLDPQLNGLTPGGHYFFSAWVYETGSFDVMVSLLWQHSSDNLTQDQANLFTSGGTGWHYLTWNGTIPLTTDQADIVFELVSDLAPGTFCVDDVYLGRSLVTNGGFEAFDGSEFTDWKIIEGMWAPDTTIFKEGTQSCRVDLTEDWPGSGIYRGTLSYNPKLNGLIFGGHYFFSAWVYETGSFDVRVDLQWRRSLDNSYQNQTNLFASGTTGWHYLTWNGTIPLTADQAEIAFVVSEPALAPGTFYVDDVIFQEPNLVTNHGFEEFSGGEFTDWEINEGTWAPDTTIFKEGTQSCRVDLTEYPFTSGIYRGIISHSPQLNGLTPGGHYFFSAWVYETGPFDVRVELQWRRSSDNLEQNQTNLFTSGTTGWHYLTWNGTISSTTDRADIVFVSELESAPGTFYVDDVRLFDDNTVSNLPSNDGGFNNQITSSWNEIITIMSLIGFTFGIKNTRRKE
ncbi:MAG: carbohydrate binding domain-containing protein [Candidatus Heimdallarchaeota archaeon]